MVTLFQKLGKTIGVIVLLNLSCYDSPCQTKVIDSLKILINNEIDQEKLILHLNEISFEFLYVDPDSTKKYAERAKKLALSQGALKHAAVSNRYISIVFRFNGQYDSAINYLNKFHKYVVQSSDSSYLTAYYTDMASIKRSQGDYKESRKMYEKSYDLSIAQGKTTSVIYSLTNLAYASKLEGRYIHALKLLNNALELSNQINDPYDLHDIYAQMADIYDKTEEWITAEKYLKLAIESARVVENKRAEIISRSELAALYLKTDRFEEAVEESHQVSKEAEILDEISIKSKAEMILGEIFIQNSQLDSAFYYLNSAYEYNGNKEWSIEVAILLSEYYLLVNDIKSAEKILLKEYINMDTSFTKVNRDLSYSIAKLYKRNSNFKKSLTFFEEYHVLQASLIKENNSREFGRLEAEFEYEREIENIRILREQEEIKLNAKITKQRSYFLIALVVGIAILLLGIILYYLYRTKVKANLKLAEKNTTITKQARQLEVSTAKEKQLFQEKIDAQQRELATLAMQSNEKNNMLSQLKDKLGKMELAPVHKMQMKEIQKIISSHTQKDSSWNSFLHKFEAIYPEFFQKLKEEFEKLTLNELKLCGYIKIGMDNNEIMSVTNTASSTIKKNLNRLKKKLNLGPEDSIRDFLIGYT